MIQPGPPFLRLRSPHPWRWPTVGLAMATVEVAVPGCLFLGTCPAPWLARPPSPHKAGSAHHNTDGGIKVTESTSGAGSHCLPGPKGHLSAEPQESSPSHHGRVGSRGRGPLGHQTFLRAGVGREVRTGGPGVGPAGVGGCRHSFEGWKEAVECRGDVMTRRDPGLGSPQADRPDSRQRRGSGGQPTTRQARKASWNSPEGFREEARGLGQRVRWGNRKG